MRITRKRLQRRIINCQRTTNISHNEALHDLILYKEVPAILQGSHNPLSKGPKMKTANGMIRKKIHKNRILKAFAIFMAAMLITVSTPVATYAAQTETSQSTDSETENTKVVTIEDDEVPLAPEPIEKNSNASWWFILVAIVTATAASMYEERKKDVEIREQMKNL